MLKKILSKILLIFVPLFLISCGSFNFLKKPAEHPELNQTGVQTNDKVNSEVNNPVNNEVNNPVNNKVNSSATNNQISPAIKPSNNKILHALEAEVSQLKQSLEDLNTRMAIKNQTIQRLQNKVQLFEDKIADLEKKAQTSKKLRQKIKYKDPESLYKKARHLLLEEDYKTAAAHFSTFINDNQNHSLADNAVYWLAECHYSQGDFQQAIFIFKSLIKKYPKSEKVPDALLKTGYSYLSLEDPNRAHHYLKQVLKQYPFSPASEKAQIKLGEFN